MPMQPSPISDTSGPPGPRVRLFMARLLSGGSRFWGSIARGSLADRRCPGGPGPGIPAPAGSRASGPAAGHTGQRPRRARGPDIMSEAVFPLNLPNVLTVLRIMLVPVLVVALVGNTPAGDVLAAGVFALASLTDFVDGYLARARDSITTFGKLMDPLADKLLVVAALISLVSLHRLAAWVEMVIITRDLAVTVLRLGATQAGVVMAASMFGKIKTCLQIATVLAVIAVHGQPPWVLGLIYLTVLITVLSGLDYFFGLRR